MMMLRVWTAMLVMLGGVSATVAMASDAASPPAIGRSIADFTLDNCYGKPVSTRDYADKPYLVVAFLGTECPLAKLYGRRLSDLHSRYADRGVAVLGIDANKQDSLSEMLAYANRHELNFPFLKDRGNRVADAMGAERTPEVFLLDRQRVVRYHGRIDDQYGVGVSRDKTVRADLENALDELLAGKEVSVPETEVIGCHIGRVKELAPTGDITYTRHIAPILNAHCVSCHREGEIAPFTLTGYEDILGWEDTILEVIKDRRMPPWSANPAHGRFANDPRLSEKDKELLRKWVENGMPEGDPADLPTPPEFTPGWQIPKPDQIIVMDDEPFTVPAEGVVDYQRFVVDPGWDEDKYIYAAEARPQNRSVVHHILVYVIPPGKRRADLRQIIVGYAPGGLPVQLPEGVAIHVAAGSKLLFEMHYTPNGYEQTDLSYAGVCFVDESKVEKHVKGRIAVNTQFQIPPEESDHEVVARYVSRKDEMLLSMTPHMHLRGKSFRYDARYPDGREETLLDVPRYDFNWQLKYILEQPKRLPRGTIIQCTAVFDNSAENLANPDPSRTVGWGDQSWNEMMIGFMDTIPVE
ncbi:redoxin domain-containing protein [Roseimaritima sediminicola]|uniref:redoxin domain-containing protein n=1 Tax=Roseimaritima sediminicola TaxID=2662066 RepID=UPI0012984718|nr:redoxin domain-containing protein [Roseimaritima sediminicola]